MSDMYSTPRLPRARLLNERLLITKIITGLGLALLLLVGCWSGTHLEPVDPSQISAPITAGAHELRVAFYQLTGWTELRVDFVLGSSRSTGSAGPH